MVTGLRAGVVVALDQQAGIVGQCAELFGGFDAFNDAIDAELLGEADGGSNKGHSGGVVG